MLLGVMFCMCLARDWHCLGGVPCWSRYVTVGVGLSSLSLLPGSQYSSSSFQIKIENSQLLLYHVCLDAAMLPP